MGSKIRKQIYLDAEQEAILKLLSAEKGISEAEIIRQAIIRYSLAAQKAQRNLKAWEEEKAFMQKIINQSNTSVSTKKRTWNREDLYDRKILRRY